ncbi:MAG: hypothetical protein DWQ06_15990 [Calditrichaeota bacterium]|nr:MAG: hypothetical protein DWQ06_15990 [Calditrichota bacterium]
MQKSDYTIKFLAEDKFEIWNTLVSNSNSTIFHSLEWLSTYKRIFGDDFKLLVISKKQNVLGGCVIFPSTKLNQKTSTLPFLNYYNGIIFDSDFTVQNISSETKRKFELTSEIAIFLEKEFAWVYLSHNSALKDVRVFNDRNWNVKVSYTLRNELLDENSQFEKIRNARRRHIKKAINSECFVKEHYDFETSYNFQIEARISNGVNFRFEKDNFINFMKLLKEMNLIKSYFVFSKSGEPLGNWIVGTFKEQLFSLISGIKKGKYPEVNFIGTFLMYKVLSNEELRNDFSELDFIGANTPGIREFKGDFGGELVPFYQTEFINSKSLKSARFVKQKIF